MLARDRASDSGKSLLREGLRVRAWRKRIGITSPGGACGALGRGSLLRELFHPFGLTLLDLFPGEIFTPELIAHRHTHLRARGNGAIEERIAVLDIHPETSGGATKLFGALV